MVIVPVGKLDAVITDFVNRYWGRELHFVTVPSSKNWDITAAHLRKLVLDCVKEAENDPYQRS